MCIIMTSLKKDVQTVEKQQKTDFSVEHILTRAGEKRNLQQFVSFPWIHCTRYSPPKLPRTSRKEGPQKRQLGRHPRIPFSSQQIAVLEEKFKQTPYLSSTEVTQLSRTLQLADIRVKIWFQNRRARERRERNDQETQLKIYTETDKLKRGNSQYKTPETINTVNLQHNEIFLQMNKEKLIHKFAQNSNILHFYCTT